MILISMKLTMHERKLTNNLEHLNRLFKSQKLLQFAT